MNTGTTLALSNTGDIILDTTGRIPLISDTDKVQQDIRVLLRSAIGSLATDPGFGMDIISLAKSKNKTLMAGIIRQALKQYPYIDSIGTITISDPDRFRKISITAKLTLADGSSLIMEEGL